VELLTEHGCELLPFEPGDGLTAEVDAFLAGEPVLGLADAAHLLAVCATWRDAARTRQPLDVPALAARAAAPLPA
jgi:hypothetical protein